MSNKKVNRDYFSKLYELSSKIVDKKYTYEQMIMYKKDFAQYLEILNDFIIEHNLNKLSFLSDYKSWYIKKNYVVLNINDFKIPIKVQGDISITSNPETVCIVKKNNVQYIVPANSIELKYKVIIKAGNILGRCMYKVGDRIVLHSMRGSYIIENINDSTVKLTCKKWKLEGKPSMIRNTSDIKGYFVPETTYLPF